MFPAGFFRDFKNFFFSYFIRYLSGELLVIAPVPQYVLQTPRVVSGFLIIVQRVGDRLLVLGPDLAFAWLEQALH